MPGRDEVVAAGVDVVSGNYQRNKKNKHICISYMVFVLSNSKIYQNITESFLIFKPILTSAHIMSDTVPVVDYEFIYEYFIRQKVP